MSFGSSKRFFVVVIAAVFCLPPTILNAVIIGSDLLVSRQGFTTLTDAENEIRGFVYMDGGFALASSSVSCTFNALFPVRGEIRLNGGDLLLLTDLICEDTFTFTSLGNIASSSAEQTYNMHFPRTLLELGSSGESPWALENVGLFLTSDLILKAPLCFKGKCIIDGNNSVLELASTASILVDSDSTLLLKNISVTGLKDTNVRAVSDTSHFILQNTDLVVDGLFSFSLGSIECRDVTHVLGTGTFEYTSEQTTTINKNALLLFGNGLHVMLGKGTSGSNPLAFEDKTSVLVLDGAALHLTGSGLQLTKGMIKIKNDVHLDMQSTSTLNGLILGGTDDEVDDATIFIEPGSVLRFMSGHFSYENVLPNGVVSASNSSRLLRGEQSNIFVTRDWSLKDVSILLASNAVPSIEVATGKKVTYEDTIIVLPEGEFKAKGKQQQVNTIELDGGDTILLANGDLVVAVMVAGIDNSIVGNGTIKGPVFLQDSNAILALGINGFINSVISLGGGTIQLNNSPTMLENASIQGPGTIDLAANVLKFDVPKVSWTTPAVFQGEQGSAIEFRGRLELSSTWTISGVCQITGSGGDLVLRDNGAIVVDQNAELILKNVRVTGVSGSNIRCLDDTGIITLIDTDIVLKDDYTFTQGCLQALFDNSISGTHAFFYASAQTSTIRRNSTLAIKDGVRFSFGRLNGQEPLFFEERTSVLAINDAHLVITSSGATITRGTISLHNNSILEIASTATTNGLMLGNGTPEGDALFVFNPACVITQLSGVIVYNQSTPFGVQAPSPSARYIRLAGTNVHALKNFTLPPLTTIPSVGVSLTFEPGVSVTLKDLILDVAEIVLMRIKGRAVSLGVFALDGNGDSVTVSSGSAPFAFLITGTNNSIKGEGNVRGPISLLTSSAILSSGISGVVYHNISLSGGTLSLADDLRLGNNIVLNGPGRVELGTNSLMLGSSDMNWVSPIVWNGNGGSINMRANLHLSNVWTFSGECTVNGAGYVLRLEPAGKMILADGARVTLRNIHIEGINTENIQCTDSSTTLILDDVDWIQDANYSFTTGSILFKNNVDMRGGRKELVFAYQSIQTSTIQSLAHVRIDENLTFSYDPADASKDLLVFENNSSILELKNSTLVATRGGMDITQGTLSILGNSVIEASGIVDDEGVTVGDGDVNDDATVFIAVGSTLRIKKGVFKNKNKNQNSWIFANTESVIQIDTGAEIDLFETLDLGAGRAIFKDGSTRGEDFGKQIKGTTVPQGTLFIRNLST